MDNKQKLESVRGWLTGNLEQRIKDNDFLSSEQTTSLIERVTALIGEANEENLDSIIERGNATLLEMNNWINEEREKRLPTKDEFLAYMYANKEEAQGLDSCKFVMGLFDDMLDLKLYDRAIEYMTAVDITKVQHPSGTLFCMMTGSNPISPLLRPIPKQENIAGYSAKRYEYFESVKKYYEEQGNEELAKCIRIAKPENYEEDVKSFDMLYMGGAPKER